MARVFLDTNIVLDMIDRQRPGHPVMGRFIRHLVENGVDVVISEDMISTVFYIVKDKHKALDFLATVQKRWIVSAYGPQVISEAINRCREKTLDLEDVLQCLCAKTQHCDVLITNDKNFSECGVPVLTPEAFLAR